MELILLKKIDKLKSNGIRKNKSNVIPSIDDKR